MTGGPQLQVDYIGQKTANGEAPTKGPRALALNLDFSISSTIAINLQHAQTNNKLEFVQGVYVDNSLNSAPLYVRCRITQHQVTFPPYTYGYLSFFTNTPAHIEFQTSTTNVISAQLCSFPVANFIQNVGAGATGNAAIQMSGSTGQDYSANKPSLEANLLATVPVNAARNQVYVQNQSANPQQVVLDDGAGNNISIILLSAGGGANAQGADWTSQTFKGRLRIYSTSSTDQVCVHQD